MADKLPQIMIPNRAVMTKYYPALAQEVGDIESLLLLQIEFWLHQGKKVKWEDGIAWLDKGEREIARDMGMKHNTVRLALEQLEIAKRILRKPAQRGARRPLTLGWESVRKLHSLQVIDDSEVCEDETKVCEDRTQLDKDSLDSNESSSSSLLTRLAALEKENQALRAELNKKQKPKEAKAAKPANWGSVLAYVNQLWPGGAGASARKLEAAWETYPQLWDQVIPVLDKCFAKLGAKAYSPGAFVFSEFEVMAAIGQAPQGGEGADTKVSSWRRSHANRGES